MDDGLSSSSDVASVFDCQRPKPSFIVYNNNAFFLDSSAPINQTKQDVSSFIVSAKVGQAASVQLNTSAVEYTLARPVRNTRVLPRGLVVL